MGSQPSGENSSPTLAAADNRQNVPIVPDYELLRRVGAGAYGEIWLARSLATGVLRAAKIVWRHHFDDDRPFQREFEGIQRFERISREHPSQLALFHIGRNDAAGYFYYVVELADPLQNSKSGRHGIEGPNSDAELKSIDEIGPNSDLSYVPHTLRSELERGPLPADRVLTIGLALTEALANLHAHGLVHRDVKPSNVIFVNGRPKLADIGLVTAVGDRQSIVGTEGYIAPEGSGLPQSDIYALGKVLYEAATGFDRRKFPRLPPDLRDRPDGNLVLELNEIVLKASAASQDVRYRNAEAMNADLALLKAGQSVKRLRAVERRLAFLTRTAVVVSLCFVVASAIFYETYRQRQAALRSLVRLYVGDGTHQLNDGDLFGSLLSYGEALRLDAGNRAREEGHRIRIASVLRQCPKPVGMFAHGTAPVNDAAFTPDCNRLITAGEDHVAKMWDLASGQMQFLLRHKGTVYSVGFSPDGERIVTTSSDGVHFWDAHTGKSIQTAPVRHRAWHNGPSPEFSPDGVGLLTLTDKHTVVNWNSHTGEPIGKPLRHDNEVTAFMFSPEGRRILTISEDRFAQLWDASSGDLVHPFRHEGQVNWGAFSNDGRTIATGGADNFTRFWDAASGKELSPPIAHPHSVDFLAFSPEGGRLVTVSEDGTVELWDIATRRRVPRLLVHDRRVLRADFSPDGRWLAVSSEGNRVRLWDTDTGEMLPPPFVHDTPRRPVVFSPDGHLILALQHEPSFHREEIAVVWSLAGDQPQVLRIPPAVTFKKRPSLSADGRFDANISGDIVRTVVVDSSKALTQPLKQNIPFRQACFNRDNSLLITESVGGRGQLWDLSSGEPLTPLLAIVYDTNAQSVSKADLAHELRPVRDLLSLAELLSRNRIDETGGFRPLDTDALMERWSRLKRANANALIDSPAAVETWHERQAANCEQAWNWWSAVFHLKWLLAAHPDDSPLKERLAYAQLALENADSNATSYVRRRLAVFPPRNPRVGPDLVDLSRFYNTSRRVGDNSIASFPSGLQTFGGTPFDVRGVVQLSDPVQPGASNQFPSEVRNIGVNRTCHNLHFLHATAYQSAIDGADVSFYVVHYSDQRSLSITNSYGSEVRSWRTNQHESLNAACAALVWMGTNRRVESGDAESLRMFKLTWINPWPEVEVTSIDFLSNSKGVGPFLVALTAD